VEYTRARTHAHIYNLIHVHVPQVPAYASHPNYLSLTAWMCFMATLQSSALTLFLERNLNAWKINSILQFGCTLYSVCVMQR
jgi:hypothetical protein